MNGQDWLAEKFEENRGRLRGVAYRMLGSLSDADDAVQEAWLRLSHSNAGAIENLGGWLTTVTARVCLDMLRLRTSQREEPLGEPEAVQEVLAGANPEQEALLADSVGLALLVVLDRLSPAERLAFVLHDLFAVPFEEIASIVGRSPEAARQLASRARRRVQGGNATPGGVSAQREVVDAFLAALRKRDFEALLAVLDPDVVVSLDAGAGSPGAPRREIHGAQNWAKGAMAFARSQFVRFTEPALVDGMPGLIWAPRGRLLRALEFVIAGGKITHIDVVADPSRLRRLNLAILNE